MLGTVLKERTYEVHCGGLFWTRVFLIQEYDTNENYISVETYDANETISSDLYKEGTENYDYFYLLLHFPQDFFITYNGIQKI